MDRIQMFVDMERIIELSKEVKLYYEISQRGDHILLSKEEAFNWYKDSLNQMYERVEAFNREHCTPRSGLPKIILEGTILKNVYIYP